MLVANNQADDQVPAPLRAWEPPLLVELPVVAAALDRARWTTRTSCAPDRRTPGATASRTFRFHG